MNVEPAINDFLGSAATQDNPIDALRHFLADEERFRQAKLIDKMRFVGYVLELGFESAKIITSDPYKLAVGGIPRGSFLIMTLSKLNGVPPHFTLLRVTGVSPTPLNGQVQQTYFELHKKSMPELDIWTQSELQWGALDCDVLGMFYPNPERSEELSFSGDVNNVVSAHRYSVYAPDEKLLNLIVNGLVKTQDPYEIGKLRTMESELFTGNGNSIKTPVRINMNDFMGFRTAMFGKTRLGKSNVVKLIAQGMLDATAQTHNVGQLIFDINGEYANDNPQDGNKSLRSANAERCIVYALEPRAGTPSRRLSLNFYEKPDQSIGILASMLEQDGQNSNYIKSFASVELPSIEAITALGFDEKTRPIRRIQIYWAILHKAGFSANESKLRGLGLASAHAKHFDPHFNAKLREEAYKVIKDSEPPEPPNTLNELLNELEVIAAFRKTEPKSKHLTSSSGNPLFEAHDSALLDFLVPSGSSSGPSLLRSYMKYNSPDAGDYIKEILKLLDEGKTVILDLGNSDDKMRRYFSDLLSKAVFSNQETKFVNNNLGQHYVQLYFEEAHNLFPPDNKDLTGIYARFAKEGAKFHIGMVYSTQSPSTINRELLVQTENFFVGHLSSQDETKALSRLQIAFAGVEQDILRAKTPGFMRMLTASHRFIIPVQAKKFQVD